jgi:hypothetical protein
MERVTAMLRQGDVVDVVLQISISADAWCRIAFAGHSEPLGYVLCFNLERGHFASRQFPHTQPIAEPSRSSTITSASSGATSGSAALTNRDVLDMRKAGLPQDVLLAKIKSSDCNFDTSPSQLSQLKSAGLPDGVILAMVQVSSGQPTPSGLATQQTPLTPIASASSMGKQVAAAQWQPQSAAIEDPSPAPTPAKPLRVSPKFLPVTDAARICES